MNGIVVAPVVFRRRRWGLRVTLLSVPIVVASAATPARADTTLTVDLSTTIRPVTHAASGSLYGVTEKLPADVTGLIAPLHPFVFNNPAADVQQPVGDAIAVAGRVAPTGAKVSIRLADLFAGWPYKFTTVSDWLDKVGQTVTRKQASGVSNYYGYEIWNEPNGTWTSSTPFNDFWQQTYAKLRQLDPEAKLIGPSISYFDANYLKSFLTFAKANNCVPDIISWHELSGGNLTANFQSYRSLEQQLGIGPLPISINEYSGKNDLTVEGQPGASAPMIAKFERFKIDSACISYWDVSHPGRLGSLLATDTTRNGGWWFYKWYGDMTGDMVGTTPPTPNDPAALDGFANLDSTTKTASVVLGGVNDGTIRVVVSGFAASALAGSKVHAVVEHTPFANRTTSVTATDTVSTADLSVSGDQITVSISNANGTDGYRVSLSPVGGQTAGGGAGGAGGTGAGGANGGAATGGTGGAQVGGGGNQGVSGSTTSEGGASAAGTSSEVGGASSGGSLSSAGGGLANASGGPGVTPSNSDNGSCSCSAAGRGSLPVGWFAAVAGLALSLLRRRQRAAC
jgi:MYXO-CTERM domain-containing protein